MCVSCWPEVGLEKCDLPCQTEFGSSDSGLDVFKMNCRPVDVVICFVIYIVRIYIFCKFMLFLEVTFYTKSLFLFWFIFRNVVMKVNFFADD